MDGTDDGREEEAETLDLQSYSVAIEQIWMVPAMGEKKKQKCQIHILALAAIEQVLL